MIFLCGLNKDKWGKIKYIEFGWQIYCIQIELEKQSKPENYSLLQKCTLKTRLNSAYTTTSQ